MNIDELRDYCLMKKGVEEGFPFGEDTLVFKVCGKLFLLTGINAKPLQFNVKCKPATAIELREKYACVMPGYHMNKAHWNTVVCDGSVPKKLLFGWVDDSYSLVFDSLPKKARDKLSGDQS